MNGRALDSSRVFHVPMILPELNGAYILRKLVKFICNARFVVDLRKTPLDADLLLHGSSVPGILSETVEQIHFRRQSRCRRRRWKLLQISSIDLNGIKARLEPLTVTFEILMLLRICS